MSTLTDLLESIFDGEQTVLSADFERWARNSRRFRAFAEANRSKIRAKLRNARDREALADLSAELEVAALLLADDRFSVQYEKYLSSRQRGPDFTVAFRTHTPFNIEVRRVRALASSKGGSEAQTARVMAILSDKIQQMPPGIVNILWFVVEDDLSEADLANATTSLRLKAERKEEDYFIQRGFESAAAFLRHYHRLSAIALYRVGEIVIWQNPLARQKPRPDLLTALGRLRIAW